MIDDSPLQICGWMQFKHEHSGERVSAPAIASFVSRPINWGEKERMALALRSPVTDISGFWEEVRHDMWARGVVDEGKLWTPMGFKPNDPSVADAIGTRIADVLAHTPGEARKNKSPERRLGSCRFDEWFKGYCVDLVWDPLRDLEPTARTLAAMASEGLIHGDGFEMTQHWLGQPLSRLAERRPYANTQARPAAPSGDSKTSKTNATPAAKTAISMDAPPKAIAAAPIATPIAAAPIATPIAAAPIATPVAAAPIATPVAAAPIARIASDASKKPISLMPEDDESDNDREARAIFGGPDLPNFSTIARASGSEQRWRSEPEAPQEQHQTPRRAPAAIREHENTRPLSIHFGRYPRHGDDGAVDWSTALVAIDGFMEREAFDAVKRHRRAIRAGKAGGRSESLYAIDALQDLLRAEVSFELDGSAPPSKMIAVGEHGERMLDTPNYALFSLSKSSDPVAYNIPALVRAKFYRDKLSELLSRAARTPVAQSPSAGWIQLSTGPERVDATMAHPAEGLVKWSRAGGQPMLAKLVDGADQEKLRRLCSNFSAAASLCRPADAAHEGALPPGAELPSALEFAGRPRPASQGAR